MYWAFGIALFFSTLLFFGTFQCKMLRSVTSSQIITLLEMNADSAARDYHIKSYLLASMKIPIHMTGVCFNFSNSLFVATNFRVCDFAQ